MLALQSASPCGEGREADDNPDALILDVELPGLRGLALLRQIVGSNPKMSVVVLAPDTLDGRAMRAEATERGATFILKPAVDEPLAYRSIAEEIVQGLRRGNGHGSGTAAGAPPRPAGASLSRPEAPGSRAGPGPSLARAGDASLGAAVPTRLSSGTMRPRPLRGAPPQVLLVASSTGGPQALITLFSRLPAASVDVPVLIVQHMPAAFTPILAEHLTRATSWRAVEAKDEETLSPGEIRIAPGGFHMIVSQSGSTRRLRLTETPPVNFCRPSADVLFVSAAEIYGRNLLAVILTGMGNDGCEGAKVIAAAGGRVFAQDRESSVVWGMPGAAVGAGVVDQVIPLGEISAAIQLAMKGAL
ncbi:chemotaxis response regulator protein-glutamate methylesterase [Acuticoccus sp. M5D2P5]|nr:chemotaxis response regulator protein-glutamate methylesterase [Acuticoccus kalidii]